MCLTTEALALFLSLFPAEMIEKSPGQIVFHAETRDAIWKANGDKWCTHAPQIDAAFRLNGGEQA